MLGKTYVPGGREKQGKKRGELRRTGEGMLTERSDLQRVQVWRKN
jgi:hypothetical protein